MSHNWNVYKLFKNGKRAKLPLTTFEHAGDEDEADEHFQTVVLENFKEKNQEKYRDLTYSILRADRPQSRTVQQDENLQKQKIIFGRLLRGSNIKEKRGFICGLIFAKTTNWQWTWCALQSGTNQVLAELSPQFPTHLEAETWMTEQVQNLK
jgi:hypothetical protein